MRYIVRKVFAVALLALPAQAQERVGAATAVNPAAVGAVGTNRHTLFLGDDILYKHRITTEENGQALIDLVAEAGLDRGKAEAVLESDEGMEAIKEAGEQARRFQVDGVPFFIIDGRITLSGAQPPDAFLEPFRQVTAAE